MHVLVCFDKASGKYYLKHTFNLMNGGMIEYIYALHVRAFIQFEIRFALFPYMEPVRRPCKQPKNL